MRGRRCKQLLYGHKETGSLKMKHQIARSGELYLEEAMDISQDRLFDDDWG